MNNKRIGKNYIYNMIYNIIIVLTPIITTPYISRTLGAESIGIFSYCFSITTYFIVIGGLGIPLYGKREVAKRYNDSEKLNKLFSELWCLQIVIMTIALIIYFVTIICIGKYYFVFIGCGVGIISSFFDITWFFAGIEEFKSIVYRNTVVKIASILSIFIFVKSKEDILIYTMGIMLANLIGNLWMVYLARGYVKLVKVDKKKVLRHIKPSIYLLMPAMVTTIYAVIDKTMLGMITGNMSEVGFYEQSQKIITIAIVFVTSLGAVLMPRISNLYGDGKYEEVKKYICKGLSAISFISIPLVIGSISIINNLVPWFYGEGYSKVVILIYIFSPLFFILGSCDLIGTQIMISTNKEKLLLKINIVGIFVNLIFNIMLVSKYMCYGVAFATVTGEVVKYLLCLYFSRKYIDFKSMLREISKYLISALIMGGVLVLIQSKIYFPPDIFSTVTLVLIGGLTYLTILIILKDKWIFYLFNKIKNLKAK